MLSVDMFGNSVLRLSRSMHIFRSFRLVRLAKIQVIMFEVEAFAGAGGDFIALIIALMKMTFCLLIAIHICTCGWYFVGVKTANSWIQSFDQTDDHGPPSQDDYLYWYFASSRWMLAQ